MSLCLKYLVQSSKWRVELGVWEVVFLPVPEEILYSFLVYFRIVYTMYHSLDKRVWFTIIFLPLFTLFQIWIFYYAVTYVFSFGVVENRVTKANSKYFNVNCAGPEAWLFEKFIFELDASSYSFKIICLLLKQVISLKKMVVSSAKFTISISSSPICIPLIFLLTLKKLASTSVTIMFKSIENRHPWETSRVRVKGSDRRPFILIFHWILVYTSLTMWMNLPPNPNLSKAEKLKSQSTLRILQKDFFSVYLTHQLCNK